MQIKYKIIDNGCGVQMQKPSNPELTLNSLRTIIENYLINLQNNPIEAMYSRMSPDGRYQIAYNVANRLQVDLHEIDNKEPFVTFKLPEACAKNPFFSTNGKIIIFFSEKDYRKFYVYSHDGKFLTSYDELGQMKDGARHVRLINELVRNARWDVKAKNDISRDQFIRILNLQLLCKKRRELYESLQNFKKWKFILIFPIRIHANLFLQWIEIQLLIEEKLAQLARDIRNQNTITNRQ